MQLMEAFDSNKLISPLYRELNKELHAVKAEYGIMGQEYASLVAYLAKGLDVVDILDYGCGKMTLSQSLPMFTIHNYDPCIEGLDELPRPADLVTCTDVMEHIEPESLDIVLAHIAVCAKIAVFFTVCFVASKKQLPDGRNTHLIQKDEKWWLEKLNRHWHPAAVHANPVGMIYIGYTEPKWRLAGNKGMPQPKGKNSEPESITILSEE